MNSPVQTSLSTSWKVAKLHGVLLVVAGFMGFASLDPNAAVNIGQNISILAYSFLIIIGASCFFIKKKRVIGLSIISLFLVIYSVSFWITNEYYLPIGSFVIYIDLIMMTTIFFGKRAGLYSMIGIMSSLLLWLFLLNVDVIHPLIAVPRAKENATFNGILFGYFFLVASLFKENTTQEFTKIAKNEKKLSAANSARTSRINDLKLKIGQIYEVHETHIVAIKLYLEKFNLAKSDNYQLMSEELNKFLGFIDREIAKINGLLNFDVQKSNDTSAIENFKSFKPLNNTYKTFYQITIFFNTWVFILHFSELGWFNWFLVINIILCIFIYVKYIENLIVFKVIINFNICIVFVALFAFADDYLGAPVVFSSTIYLALVVVYAFGLKKTAPLLLIFSFAPYLRILLIENGFIENPIIINIVGFDLFLNLFPVMLFTYLLTTTYIDDVSNYFSKLQDTYKKLNEISSLDKKEEKKLRDIIDGISDLSNYNSHQVRAPIARLSGILNLYLSLENNTDEFEQITGYSLPTLIKQSLDEFEITFNEFDSRIVNYKSLEEESIQ